MNNSVCLEYIDFVKKCIYKYFKLIMGKNFDKGIFDSLMDTYIKVRYYNYFDIKYKNVSSNINYYMKNSASLMLDSDDDKYVKCVKDMFYLFQYVLYFDDVITDIDIKDIILEIDEYRRNTYGYIDDDFCDEILDMIKEDNKKKKVYLDSFDSERFSLNIRNTNKKNVFLCSLDYNIKFNRIYSDYSINKVYNEGIVNEQKLFITYYLISNMVLKNIVSCKFDMSYLVSYPVSLFEKSDKKNRLLSIINDSASKNYIVLTFNYSDYSKNKDEINEWIKDGFRVAIYIDDSFKYDDISNEWLTIFDYIITNYEYNYDFDSDKVINIRK